MAFFVVTFTYDASAGAMAALRPERYEYFAGLNRDGHLLASGQLLGGDLGDGLLILQADDENQARELLAADPFRREGCIERCDIAPWRPTSGAWVDGLGA